MGSTAKSRAGRGPLGGGRQQRIARERGDMRAGGRQARPGRRPETLDAVLRWGDQQGKRGSLLPAMGPAAAAAHPLAGQRPALTPRAHAPAHRSGKTPKGKKGVLPRSVCAGAQPWPRLGCDSSRGQGALRRPRPPGGGGPRGKKGPLSYRGLFWPEHLCAARAAAAAPIGARPRGGPWNGPPRSRADQNARAPPCQKD